MGWQKTDKRNRLNSKYTEPILFHELQIHNIYFCKTKKGGSEKKYKILRNRKTISCCPKITQLYTSTKLFQRLSADMVALKASVLIPK